MNNRTTALIIIILFIAFSIFVSVNNRFKTVLSVESPSSIKIDLNENNIICSDDIEAFSLNPDDDFVNKYSDLLKISRTDIISLGFLAQEFAQKTLMNKKVTIIYTPKITKDCKYANIKLNGMDYSTLLANSGFGIRNNKIVNEDKFKENLDKARKLNLVILNHHSGKFHTLDCPYGNAAHDFVMIPAKQLPANVIPCKYCHNIQDNNSKIKNLRKDFNIFNVANIVQPSLTITDGDIKFCPIHVVDQVDEDLFRPALAQIMDEKEDFCHSLRSVLIFG